MGKVKLDEACTGPRRLRYEEPRILRRTAERDAVRDQEAQTLDRLGYLRRGGAVQALQSSNEEGRDLPASLARLTTQPTQPPRGQGATQ